MENLKFNKPSEKKKTSSKFGKFADLTAGDVYMVHSIKNIDTKYGQTTIMNMSSIQENNGFIVSKDRSRTYFAPSTIWGMLKSYGYENILKDGDMNLLMQFNGKKTIQNNKTRYEYRLTTSPKEPEEESDEA